MSNKRSFSANKQSFSANKLVAEWINAADNDYFYAKIGFAESELYANVCFTCQQAFEKYLKAYLIANSKDFPKTHDLTKLLALCISKDNGFSSFLDDASVITPYAVAARYPDISALEFTKQQTQEALSSVLKLSEFVKNKLGSV